jgi:hypothetical protein
MQHLDLFKITCLVPFSRWLPILFRSRHKKISNINENECFSSQQCDRHDDHCLLDRGRTYHLDLFGGKPNLALRGDIVSFSFSVCVSLLPSSCRSSSCRPSSHRPSVRRLLLVRSSYRGPRDLGVQPLECAFLT